MSRRSATPAPSTRPGTSAPWHIIPADRKWFRNLAIAEVLAGAMRELAPSWRAALDEMSAARVAELQAFRAGQTPE